MLLAIGCNSGGGSSSSGFSTATGAAIASATSTQKVLPFTNGLAAASYDVDARKIDTFRDHLYATVTPAPNEWKSKDFCYDLYFGYRREGKSRWLTEAPITYAGYLEGTGIVRVIQKVDDVTYETFYFTPMGGPEGQAMVALVHAVNEGADAKDCSLFSLMNFRAGGNDDAKDEWAYYDPQGNFLMEGKTGTGNRLVYQPIAAYPTHASFAKPGKDSAWERVNANEHLIDPQGAVNGEDVACGFEWQIEGGARFPKGSDTWAGFVVAYASNGDEPGVKQLANDVIDGKSPLELLKREIAWWEKYHSVEKPPVTLSPKELALYRQSTAVLKMSQCREKWAAEGQIVASLPPGQWNICWPRDASYSIVALTRTGHLEEAKKGLEFFLKGKANKYQKEVGKKYLISVCRYFGNGEEESDDDNTGPNIEFDNFGLFLWAFAEYVEKSKDLQFLKDNYPLVRDEVGDVLVSLVEPTNGLLKSDSSIWERHMNSAPNSPSGRKQFAYSSINAVNGLTRLSALAKAAGDGAKATEYDTAAKKLNTAIEKELCFADGAIASSPEEKKDGLSHAADGAVMEAVNFGLFDAKSVQAKSTLAYMDRELKAWPFRSPGYLRNDDARDYTAGNWYDRMEWVMIDLRIASACVKMGKRDQARELIDWVTNQSDKNMNLIAELYDASSSSYQGAVPMVGFGAGVYLLALDDYHR